MPSLGFTKYDQRSHEMPSIECSSTGHLTHLKALYIQILK